MRKLMMIGVLGIVAHFCGIIGFSAAAQKISGVVTPPKACYFFAPEKQNATEPPEELAYGNSVNEVWRLWCTGTQGSPDQRQAAVDNMVKSWRAVWERKDPFDTAFHETAAFDILKLMGLTHELPARIAADPKFKEEWIEACKENCFTIWSVPDTPIEEHRLAMDLWLRNDVLDNLRKEPASESVINMFREAQYRLVN